MTLLGTDTSASAKDAAKLKAAGCLFSYPRCVSEASDGSIDPGFAAMAKADRAAGRITGGYDFLTKGYNGGSTSSGPSVAAKHAGLFVQAAGPFIKADPAFLAVIDLETSKYRAKADWADVKAWVATFRKSFPVHPVGLYLGAYHAIAGEPADWEASIGPAFWILPWYPLASVSTVASVSSRYAAAGGDAAPQWSRSRGGKHPALWQFNGTTAVAGQSVDLDAFRGTADQLKVLIAPPPPAPIDTTPFSQAELDAAVTLATDALRGQVAALTSRLATVKAKVVGLASDVADD